jgi:integrase
MKGTIRPRGKKFTARYYDPKTKKEIFKTLPTYKDAEYFLNHLIVEEHEGSLDARDYQKDNPLGFSNLAKHWLRVREGQVRCFRNLKSHMDKASDFFGSRNVKEIGYGELEDFLASLPPGLSGKTKANILATLHSFLVWVARRERGRGYQVPEFPEAKFILGWRNTVDKETQTAIIEEVKRISYHINPRIWIGIKWLSTYVAIRPIELINIKEGDFDLGLGVVNVKHNKVDKPKIVPMLEEDIELVRSFGKALPSLYFFRHASRKGLPLKKRYRFGKDYLYSWWKSACKNLRIEGVDLYGGTRHSTVRALREHFTPDQVKLGTMHTTNAAFERYYQIELEDARKVYRAARMLPVSESGTETRKVVNLQPDMVRKAGLEPAMATGKK